MLGFPFLVLRIGVILALHATPMNNKQPDKQNVYQAPVTWYRHIGYVLGNVLWGWLAELEPHKNYLTAC